MKVIILGAGGRGNVYAKYFSENGVEIAGLADPNTERLHKVATAMGFRKQACTIAGKKCWRSPNLRMRL